MKRRVQTDSYLLDYRFYTSGFVFSKDFSVCPTNREMANGNADNKIVSENKLRIKKGFKDKLRLLVDKPKPELENSNDRNTAVRFVRNP